MSYHLSTEYRDSPRLGGLDSALFRRQLSGVEPALFTRRASVRDHRRHRHTLRVNRETAQRIRDTGRSCCLHRCGGGRIPATRAPRWRHRHRCPVPQPGLGGRTGHGRRHGEHVAAAHPHRRRSTCSDAADQVAERVWDLQARQRFAYGDIVSALSDGAGTFPTLFDESRSLFRRFPTPKTHSGCGRT